jgi:hypothetical protein
MRSAVSPGPAHGLVDQAITGTDIWHDLARRTVRLGNAATPPTAFDQLQSFLAQSPGEPDPW